MSQRVGAQGGGGGGSWDDGAKMGIKKVYVGGEGGCVTYLKFEYANTSMTYEHGPIHHFPQEFEVDYPNEYITSVEGTYAKAYISSVVITSLVFKTSLGRTSPTMGNQGFVLENNGQKIVGFHGRAGDAIDAIGAYFVPNSSSEWAPALKLEAQGGDGGAAWDDEVYNSVTKVHVGRDDRCVTKVKFDYIKNGGTETREHGKLMQELDEFLVDYPGEYITSMEGTYGKVAHHVVVTTLAFTTSKGRKSPTYGATKFVLQDSGRQVVGFHGRSGNVLDAIGAYFGPPPS